MSQPSALMTVWLILIPAGLVLPMWDEDLQTQRLALESSSLMLRVARPQTLFRLLRAALGSEMQSSVGSETTTSSLGPLCASVPACGPKLRGLAERPGATQGHCCTCVGLLSSRDDHHAQESAVVCVVTCSRPGVSGFGLSDFEAELLPMAVAGSGPWQVCGSFCKDRAQLVALALAVGGQWLQACHVCSYTFLSLWLWFGVSLRAGVRDSKSLFVPSDHGKWSMATCRPHGPWGVPWLLGVRMR